MGLKENTTKESIEERIKFLNCRNADIDATKTPSLQMEVQKFIRLYVGINLIQKINTTMRYFRRDSSQYFSLFPFRRPPRVLFFLCHETSSYSSHIPVEEGTVKLLEN